jgi:hypothetical protein
VLEAASDASGLEPLSTRCIPSSLSETLNQIQGSSQRRGAPTPLQERIVCGILLGWAGGHSGRPLNSWRSAKQIWSESVLHGEMMKSLPVPTSEQTARFADHVTDNHSWYKHLPFFPPGASFVFFPNPHAGRGVRSEDGRLASIRFPDRVASLENVILGTDWSGTNCNQPFIGLSC